MNPRSVYGLDYELDNTPRWLEDHTKGIGRRCNPFGYEDSNMRVLGGIADPRHELHIWRCENLADGRYRMTCVNGHAGVMDLCYAHVYQIQRRMNGLCPRCSHPDAFRAADETCQRLIREWMTMPSGRQRSEIGRRIEELRQMMTEMYQRGDIKTGAPLRLTEVS